MQIQAFVLLAFAFSVQVAVAADSLRGKAAGSAEAEVPTTSRMLADVPAKCSGQPLLNFQGLLVYGCENKRECLDKCDECDNGKNIRCVGIGLNGEKACSCLVN